MDAKAGIETVMSSVRKLSRRTFLAAAAVGTAAGASPAGGQSASGSVKEILVLGAGMSGLTAALALQGRGHKVTVIEYQDRIGGRLLSVPLAGGQFSEAGGGHFRSNMPYVLSYIRHFKLPILSLNDGLPRYTLNGKTGDAANLADWPWALAAEERNVTVASSLNRYLYRAGLDTDTVLDSRWPDPQTLEALDTVTVGDLIRHFGASEAFCGLLNAHGGTFTAASQALGAIPDLAYHFGDQNVFRIMGGNNRLPMAMANAIGMDRIVLGEPVTEIDDSGARVRVGTAGGRAFTGDGAAQSAPWASPIALWQRPLVAADAVAFYLCKIVWPARLCVDYGRRPGDVIASGVAYYSWLLPAGVLAIAVWFGATHRRTRGGAAGLRHAAPLAALALFVLPLLPVLGLVPFDSTPPRPTTTCTCRCSASPSRRRGR